MKGISVAALCLALFCALTLTAYGQMIQRTDAVWARTTTNTITLDGLLNEPDWAVAESIHVMYGMDAGMPGSGWLKEVGKEPIDPTDATIKFLVKGNDLYVAFICRDQSVGGGTFNRFDGILSNLRYKLPTGFGGTPGRDWNTSNPFEIFYGWVTEGWADTTLYHPGTKPGFFGWAANAPYQPRTDSLRAIWDAATFVNGTDNDDSGAPDVSWVTEMKLGLTNWFYDATNPSGEILMWSTSIYDADWGWPLDTTSASNFSGTRTWTQCPWGNASAYNHLRIFVRPDVTTSTVTVPVIGPDIVIPDGKNYATPVIDGNLTEEVWKQAPSLKIKYGDAAIRDAYPNDAPYRSGQTQPKVNGGLASVLDPNLATVKYFFKDDALYLGFDVEDQVVQGVDNYDRFDGFRIVMCERDTVGEGSVLRRRLETFVVSEAGGLWLRDNLLADSARALVAMALKGGTTVDTLGTSPDSGYTAEMKIDLTKFGYPAGRGDGVVFMGIVHYDGDSFTPATLSYGTRTWFMRPDDWNDGSAWMYMDPASVLTDVAANKSTTPAKFALLGNYPNPFNPATTIRFQLPQTSEVTLRVYDMLGRQVATQSLGAREAGDHAVSFNAMNLASGSYYYRLEMKSTGASLTGKMMLLK